MRNVVYSAIQIALKDLRIEFRTKKTINFIFLFSFLTISIFSVSIPLKSAEALTPPLLWFIFLFAGVIGYSRAFLREVEDDTLDGLKMIFPPHSILLGKLFYNLAIMLFLESVIIPLFIIFFDLKILHPLEFFISVTIGNLAFVTVSTSLSILTIKSSTRELLLPIILFPIVFPVITVSIKAISSSLFGSGPSYSSITFILIYSLVMLILSFSTIEQAISE
jgi:heme exporter protein B